MKKYGKLAGAGIAAGLAGVLGKQLYDVGKQFDEAFDTIRVGTGKTGKSLRGLQGDFKSVVKGVPTDFGSAGTAVADLNRRLGLTGKPLQAVSKQILELSRLTKTDLNENIASVSRVFGDWSVKTTKQAGSLDKLFRVSQATGIGVSELSRLMVAFGSPLRQLGFNFDQAAAMFAKFEKEGVNIQTTMPGFRFALKNLSAPTKEAAAVFEKLGINLKEGPAKSLREVMAAIKSAPTDMKANAIAFSIFGRRAGPDMAAAIREGRFEYGNLTGTMRHGSDTVLKAARDTNDFSEKWQMFKNRVLVGLQPVATAFFNVVGKGMDAIASVNLGKVIADFRSSGAAMAALGAIAGALAGKMAAMAVVWAVGKVAAFASAIRTAASAVNVLSAAVARNPIGLLAVVIGTVAGALLGFNSRQREARVTADDVANALDRQRDALQRLRDAEIDAKDVKNQARLATLDVHAAEVNLHAARKHFGRDSDEAKRAEIELSQAKIRRTRANRQVIDTEKEIATRAPKAAAISREATKSAQDRVDHIGGEMAVLRGSIILSEKDGVSKDKLAGANRKLVGLEKQLGRALADRDEAARGTVKGQRIMNRSGFDTAKTWAKVIGFYVFGINDVLKAVGAKKLNITAKGVGQAAGALAGAFGFQRGGVLVPGVGSGDKVQALLEPGEVVWNREAVRAMGGAQSADAMNRLVPRFQRGGMVDPGWDPGNEVLNRAISAAVGRWAKTYGANMTAGYDPGGGHVSPGHNVTGTATDMVPMAGWGGKATSRFEQGLRALVSKGVKVLYGTDGIGIPWPNHGRGNHAHIEWGLDAPAGLGVDLLRKVTFEGDEGPIKDMLQGGADRVRSAANSYIRKQMGGFGEGVEPGAKSKGKGNFEATAYGPPWGGIEGTGVTATGIDLRKGPKRYIIATDPSVIPLGSKKHAKPNPFGYGGTFLAGDTGGAIKGNRIDFYDWRGRESQNAWGRRNVQLYRDGGIVEGFQRFAAGGTAKPKKKKGHHKESHKRGHGKGGPGKGGLESGFKYQLPNALIDKVTSFETQSKIAEAYYDNLEREFGRTEETFLLPAAPDAVDEQGRKISELLNPAGMTDPNPPHSYIRGIQQFVDEQNSLIDWKGRDHGLLSDKMTAIGEARAALQQGIKERRDRILEIRRKVRENDRKIESYRDDIKQEQKKKKPSQSRIHRWRGNISDLHAENRDLIGQAEGPIGESASGVFGTATKSLTTWSEKFTEYDPMIQPVLGEIPSAINTIDQDVLDLRKEIADATGTMPAAPEAAGEDTSALADLLKQQLADTQKELAILTAQLPVFQRFFPPFGGSFATGGVVPGPLGAPRTIIAHGGEGVGAQSGEPVVNITFVAEAGAGIDETKFRAVVNDEVSEMVRKAKSGPAVGRRYAFRP